MMSSFVLGIWLVAAATLLVVFSSSNEEGE